MITPSLLIDFILHIDKYLVQIIQDYGSLTYLVLFLIITLENGIIILPFLPGDSLFFVSGTLASQGALNIWFLLILLIIAAILGDTINYWIGKYFGEHIFIKSKLFRKDYLQRTKQFYKKYGGKTIILARFVPIIRTFAPFVAGVGEMKYSRFLFFNVIGGIAWVVIFLFAGYYFGQMPLIKDNLSLVILLIIVISAIPAVLEYVRGRRKGKKKKLKNKSRK